MPKAGNPVIPIICYAPIVAMFVAWNVLAQTFNLAYLAGGLALWTMIEYLMHRFIFHYPPSSKRLQEIQANLHLKHHDAPHDPDQIVAQPSFSMPIALGIWLACRLALGSWESASLVVVGVIVGYVLYEFVHYGVHTMADGGPVMRAWRRYHFYHHFKNPGRAFGVTTPIWDLVFRTGRKTG